MHLNPNTIEGLKFGLKNFDSIETDIRLTKDDKLILFHDPLLPDGRSVRGMDLNDLVELGIPSFEQFLQDQEVQQLLKEKKVLWIELKPDCKGTKTIIKPIASIFKTSFNKVIEDTKTPIDSIRLISFQKLLLDEFLEEGRFKLYPLLPVLTECTYRYTIIVGLSQIIFKSLKGEMLRAKQKGYTGLLVARQYIIGLLSKRHGGYEKLCDLMDQTGIELGSNLGSIEFEATFPRLHRFSDKTQNYPRFANENEGLIVAHRGTGTKGVDI